MSLDHGGNGSAGYPGDFGGAASNRNGFPTPKMGGLLKRRERFRDKSAGGIERSGLDDQ